MSTPRCKCLFKPRPHRIVSRVALCNFVSVTLSANKRVAFQNMKTKIDRNPMCLDAEVNVLYCKGENIGFSTQHLQRLLSIFFIQIICAARLP